MNASTDTPGFETLTLESVGEHVRLIRLNRPEASNALNTQMGRDLVRYFEELALDPRGLRCVVLTGAGEKAFCAGGDLKERRGMTDEAWTRQHVIFERMARALLDCPVPIIGAVNGAAYGGGCEIAACCDFLYAAETARFALTEVTLGIMPGSGGTQTLPRAMGERRAKELILTGRPFSAAQARDWRLVNEVFALPDLMRATLAVAARIAQNAPISVPPGPSCRSIAACNCRCATDSPSRSRLTTEWFRPRTAARACSPSTRSDRPISKVGDSAAEPLQSNRLGV